MALIIADRIKESSTTTGTGALTLGGALTGFKAFSAVCANADTLYYAIQSVDSSGNSTADWEVGLGSWGTGGVLTRTTVYASSNANTFVSFAAGTKHVWIDAPANLIKSFVPYTGATQDVDLGANGLSANDVTINGKTLVLAGNFTTSGAYSSTFTMTGTTAVTFPVGGTLISTTYADFGANSISNVKNFSMSTPTTITTTTGAINLDLAAAALILQNELTGAVTYTVTTTPPQYSRGQILFDSDGTSAAYGITWPANFRFYGATFSTTIANKSAIINWWYDGTTYHCAASSQV